jgi:hypothetical protein
MVLYYRDYSMGSSHQLNKTICFGYSAQSQSLVQFRAVSRAPWSAPCRVHFLARKNRATVGGMAGYSEFSPKTQNIKSFTVLSNHPLTSSRRNYLHTAREMMLRSSFDDSYPVPPSISAPSLADRSMRYLYPGGDNAALLAKSPQKARNWTAAPIAKAP